MSHLIPEHPTPAQRRVIESDWFKEALEQSASLESSSNYEGLSSVAALPKHTLLANAIRFWSDHAPEHSQTGKVSDEEKSAWCRLSRVLMETHWTIFYHPPHRSILEDLILAICLLHPRLDMVPYWDDVGVHYKAVDTMVMAELFTMAREQIKQGDPKVQAIRARQEAVAQLDEETKKKITNAMLAKFYPKGELVSFNRRHVVFDSWWLKFSEVDPVTLLTCAFEALHARVSLFEEGTANPVAAAQFARDACLYFAINAFESTPQVRATRHHFSALICYLLSITPVTYTKADKTIYFDNYPECFAFPEALATCTALLGESGQSTVLSQLLFSQFYKKQTWTGNTRLLVEEGRSFEEAALNLWLLGAKRDRDTLLSEYIDKHVSGIHVMPALLDELERKPTSTQLKVIHELLARPGITFDAAQQQQLADAAVQVLKGKALDEFLRFTPDVTPAQPTTPAPAQPTKKTTTSKPKKVAKKSAELHPVLDGIKGKKLPKNVDAKLGASLTWSDEERALNEDEFAVLVTMLRECGPGGACHPQLDAVLKKLGSAKDLSALGFALLEQWEKEDSPAKDKWMLFQLRHTGEKKQVTKLGSQHNWESWASSGKWARAQWYLEVVAEMGPSKENDKLFIGLLDAGHIDSTLQMAARHIFPHFAKSLGFKNVQRYFVERGLLGHIPAPGKLPFEPGKTSVTLDGEEHVLLVEQAQLRLQRKSDHHKLNLTEDLARQQKSLQRYADAVHQHTILWGAFYERKHRFEESFTPQAAQKALSNNGPVHQDIFCSLLWREKTGGKVFRFDPEGTCFDVAYEPVTISKESKIQIVSLSTLKGAEEKAWFDHLTESEVILPFDLLDSAYYVARLNELMNAPFENSQYGNVVWALNELGYRKGHVEDNGIVWTHYKTFPEYNLRVFFEHTGVDVSNDDTLETPGQLKGVEFTDLLGKVVPATKVEPGALSILCDELAKFLQSPL